MYSELVAQLEIARTADGKPLLVRETGVRKPLQEVPEF